MSGQTPSTGLPRRIAALYNRRPTTAWSDKEIRAYKQVAKTSLELLEDELSLIERYYVSERKKGDKGIYRRDLLTLLNNWNGEVDRARAWHTTKMRQDYDRFAFRQTGSSDEKPLPDDEWQPLADVIKKQLEQFRKKGLTPSQ